MIHVNTNTTKPAYGLVLNKGRSIFGDTALFLDPPILNFVSAVAVGALIGAERERRKGEGPTRAPAGIRTFTITSISGAVAFAVGGAGLLAVVTASVAVMVAVSYWRAQDQDPGLTTGIVLVLTALLGGMCMQAPQTAAAIAVAVTRLDIIWSDTEIAAFCAVAPAHVALPFRLAIATGQREGDILRLTWSAYDGRVIRLRQSKSGKWLTVPLTADARAMLDAAKAKRRGTVICENSRGRPWTIDGFKTSFGKAKIEAGIENRTFHDTRGTAVVNLALAQCTVAEICSITGHSLRDAENILSKHYLAADRRLAESAIGKLETWRKDGAVGGGATSS